MNRKLTLKRIALLALLILMALFLATFEYFHIEKKLEFEEKCPICMFEKTTTLFMGLNIFFTILCFLILVAFKLHFKKNPRPMTLTPQPVGQRAPPLY